MSSKENANIQPMEQLGDWGGAITLASATEVYRGLGATLLQCDLLYAEA